MIFIVITILAIIGLNVWGIMEARGSWGDWMDWAIRGVLGSMGVLLVWALIALPLQLVVPTNYEAPEVVEETEIVSLANDLGVDGHGRIFYVSVDTENVYSYRVKTESNLVEDSSAVYELKTIGEDEKVLEVETKDGSAPRLVRYREKGKISFWSMGLDKETYVFFVPEGSISKTIALS